MSRIYQKTFNVRRVTVGTKPRLPNLDVDQVFGCIQDSSSFVSRDSGNPARSVLALDAKSLHGPEAQVVRYHREPAVRPP